MCGRRHAQTTVQVSLFKSTNRGVGWSISTPNGNYIKTVVARYYLMGCCSKRSVTPQHWSCVAQPFYQSLWSWLIGINQQWRWQHQQCLYLDRKNKLWSDSLLMASWSTNLHINQVSSSVGWEQMQKNVAVTSIVPTPYRDICRRGTRLTTRS